MKVYEKREKGITLIALVITIIVLLILVGIVIAALSGENGILTRATQSTTQTDIAETKEQIKIELMGLVDTEGKYTNSNVIEAVKKVTGEEIEEGTEKVKSLKQNIVDISDLWLSVEKIYFTLNGKQFSFKKTEYLYDWGGKEINSLYLWLEEASPLKDRIELRYRGSNCGYDFLCDGKPVYKKGSVAEGWSGEEGWDCIDTQNARGRIFMGAS